MSFIFPLELGEHMVYDWTNKRYIKGILCDKVKDLSSVGRLLKAKGIDN